MVEPHVNPLRLNRVHLERRDLAVVSQVPVRLFHPEVTAILTGGVNRAWCQHQHLLTDRLILAGGLGN